MPHLPRSFVKPLFRLSLFAPFLVLAGCALPVPIQVASWVADGVSYIATSKTIVDHGISAMVGKDCAMLRGLSGEDACRDEIPDMDADIAVAAAAEPEAGDTPDAVPPVEAVNPGNVRNGGGSVGAGRCGVHPQTPGRN